MSNPEKNFQKLQKRADKNLWITTILTFFIPFGGYLYTARYLTAIVVFLAMVFFLPDTTTTETGSSLYGFFLIGVVIENFSSVRRARKLVKEKELEPKLQSSPSVSMPNLQVQMLKAGQNRSEMTLSDYVIATELPPEQIKEILQELERLDLVRSYNRESDGAVVYKVV